MTLANAGKEVILVERQPTIGGHMAMFDKTFPTLDCAACILTPKMTSVKDHPKITLLTFSEVEEVSGSVGNYQVKVRRRARFVQEELCVGCGKCVLGCAHFGNGSLFLQVRHDLCLNCNECAIARNCPSDAFRRVPASDPYLMKGEEQDG